SNLHFRDVPAIADYPATSGEASRHDAVGREQQPAERRRGSSLQQPLLEPTGRAKVASEAGRHHAVAADAHAPTDATSSIVVAQHLFGVQTEEPIEADQKFSSERSFPCRVEHR